MAGQFSGSKDKVFISSRKYLAAESPTVEVPQNARSHQIAMGPIAGDAATVGTATITVTPAGQSVAIALLESDGVTPVVLDIAPGDARSDIRASLQSFTATVAGYDGDAYKLTITSYF